MGAELWYYEAPWDDDPARALAALQTRIFVENYNLAEVRVLPTHESPSLIHRLSANGMENWTKIRRKFGCSTDC